MPRHPAAWKEIMDNPKKATYAFIDSQNLNLSVLYDLTNKSGKINYQGWKLDFERFFVYLKDKVKVDNSYLFIGRVDGNKKLSQTVIPNKYSYSSLLRKYRPYMVFVTDLKAKLKYRNKKRGSNLRTEP